MDNLQEFKKALAEAENTEEDFPGQNHDYRMQIIVNWAVQVADEIILEGSDGSVEETDYLTSAVALQIQKKVHQAIVSRLLRKRLFKEQ